MLWFIANRYLGVPYYVLPPVEGVLAALYRGYVQGDFGRFRLHAGVYGDRLRGRLHGGLIIGVLFAEYRWLERCCIPLSCWPCS